MSRRHLTTRSPSRRTHAGQSGLTLIELTIAVAITALISLSLAAALTISFRIVGTNGVTGEQVASGSLLTMQDHLGTDVSHAECVTTDGSCPSGIPLPGVCGGGFTVCVAWCEGNGMRGAKYTLANGNLVRHDAGTSITVGREVQFRGLVASGGGGPGTLQVDVVAGTAVPQRASFTLRSAVTRAVPCG